MSSFIRAKKKKTFFNYFIRVVCLASKKVRCRKNQCAIIITNIESYVQLTVLNDYDLFNFHQIEYAWRILILIE